MKYPIIAFTGSGMGAGKTEAVMELARLLGDNHKIIKFAQPIYEAMFSVCNALNIEFDKSKIRPLMQFMGTHMRETYGENFWVDSWEMAVDHHRFFFNAEDTILVDDVRYDNEAQRIKQMGGIIIRVTTDERIRAERIQLVGAEHSSEKGINDAYVTAEVFNNGTLDEFKLNLKYIFEVLNAKV